MVDLQRLNEDIKDEFSAVLRASPLGRSKAVGIFLQT